MADKKPSPNPFTSLGTSKPGSLFGSTSQVNAAVSLFANKPQTPQVVKKGDNQKESGGQSKDESNDKPGGLKSIFGVKPSETAGWKFTELKNPTSNIFATQNKKPQEHETKILNIDVKKQSDLSLQPNPSNLFATTPSTQNPPSLFTLQKKEQASGLFDSKKPTNLFGLTEATKPSIFNLNPGQQKPLSTIFGSTETPKTNIFGQASSTKNSLFSQGNQTKKSSLFLSSNEGKAENQTEQNGSAELKKETMFSTVQSTSDLSLRGTLEQERTQTTFLNSDGVQQGMIEKQVKRGPPQSIIMQESVQDEESNNQKLNPGLMENNDLIAKKGEILDYLRKLKEGKHETILKSEDKVMEYYTIQVQRVSNRIQDQKAKNLQLAKQSAELQKLKQEKQEKLKQLQINAPKLSFKQIIQSQSKSQLQTYPNNEAIEREIAKLTEIVKQFYFPPENIGYQKIQKEPNSIEIFKTFHNNFEAIKRKMDGAQRDIKNSANQNAQKLRRIQQLKQFGNFMQIMKYGEQTEIQRFVNEKMKGLKQELENLKMRNEQKSRKYEQKRAQVRKSSQLLKRATGRSSIEMKSVIFD